MNKQIEIDIFTSPMDVTQVTPAPATNRLKKKLAEVQKRQMFFSYQGIPYMRIVPSKKLFNSTMVYEVVTRGSFFAANMQTGVFTVLPAGADI